MNKFSPTISNILIYIAQRPFHYFMFQYNTITNIDAEHNTHSNYNTQSNYSKIPTDQVLSLPQLTSYSFIKPALISRHLIAS